VSSTRLILSQGVQFDGKMVRAFGDFVVGTKDASGLVIGIIIFAILTLVQFIVITKGATRVSEVAARFSLDSMPNKYMAIDMDAQNGVIDEKEAIRRRLELQEESSFFGSMDGASNFVKGDVIMGIIITFVNIIGGFTVGMLIRNEDFNTALTSYVQLTVGDGLVSQIPSLLISTATGLIVTRSQAKEALGASVWKQLSNQYRVFYISGGTLGALALLPGFPHIILALLAAGMVASGYFLQRAESDQKIAKEHKKEQKDEHKGPENVTGLLKVDPLSLFIGYELIPLVDKSKGAELLNSIGAIRRTFAMEMGLIVPPIRILDNLKLLPNEYSFQIRGQDIGKGRIKIGHLMAMGEATEDVDGEKTIEPAFKLPALWIKNELRERAESIGLTVVDIPTIISTHIQELLRQYAFEILGREETTQIIDNLKNDYPNVVEDVLKGYTKAQIQKILQQLLKEGVSIKDLPTIFETLGDHSPQTSYFDLIEYVRQSLRRSICNKYIDDDKKLHILRVHPKIENDIYKSITIEQDGTPIVRLNPEALQKIQSVIRDKIMEMYEAGYQPLIVTQPPVRRALWEICQHINKNIAVLSTREITSDIEIVLFGQIILEELVKK